MRIHGTPRITVLVGRDGEQLWREWLAIAALTGATYGGADLDRAIRDAYDAAIAIPERPVAILAERDELARWRDGRDDRLAAMIDEGMLVVPETRPALREPATPSSTTATSAPTALLDARLFPDMYPLTRQVQLVSDHAKGAGARLAGIAVPSFEDTEKTFDELQARIAKTTSFLGSLKKEQFANAATREIVLKIGGQERKFAGAEYLSRSALPNFYFHLTTVYAILRHNGVEIGKGDYMGRI